MASPPPAPAGLLTRWRFWAAAAACAAVVAAGLLLPYLLLPGKPTAPPAHSVSSTGTLAEPGVELGLLTRLAVCTVAVLVLVPGVLLASRRWLVRAAPAQPSADLKVLGVTRLDRASVVYLVEARGQRLLVGADWGGVRLLVPVPPAIRAEEG